MWYVDSVQTCWRRQLIAVLSPPEFNPRSVHVRCVLDKMALGQVFLPELQFFPCKYRFTIAPHSSSSIHFSYQKDQGVDPGNLPKSSSLSEVWEHWIEKYFQFLPCHAMPQMVSHWPLTVEAWVLDKWQWDKFCSDDLCILPVIIIPPILHTHQHLHADLTRRKKDKAWEPSKKQCSSANREYQISNCSHFLISLKY